MRWSRLLFLQRWARVPVPEDAYVGIQHPLYDAISRWFDYCVSEHLKHPITYPGGYDALQLIVDAIEIAEYYGSPVPLRCPRIPLSKKAWRNGSGLRP